MSQAFALQLFAAPRVVRGGEPLPLGSRKAIAILAVLALDGATPRDQLAPLLWPEGSAADARRNLRRELFRLRRLSLPLEEAADGALQLGAAFTVDTSRFRAAAADGDEALALSLAAASALDGLDGVAGEAFDHWLREQRAALGRQRQRLRRDHARQRAEQGDIAAALELWLQVLDEDPCQEWALGKAMAALEARHERAEALKLYERSAAALLQQLDVAPSPALREQAAALRQLAEPKTAAPAGRALPASLARSLPVRAPPPPGLPYVERRRFESVVLAACQAGQRVYLSGVAGIGKTRLACACAAQLGAWLYVACQPTDAGLPYSSALRALRGLLDASPQQTLPEWVQRELAVLLPEMGTAAPLPDTDDARNRLLGAFAEALRLLVADNFRIVVLDDWHWCDPDSLALLAPLGGPDSAVACIVAHRSAQLPLPALQGRRQDVDDGRAVDVVLDGLDETEASRLVAAMLPADAAAQDTTRLAQRLQQATDGNPFFLIETLRHLHERSLLDARGPALPVPASVRDTVQARVRAQGEPTRRLLEAASLLGGRFDVGVLEGVTGAPADEGVTLLEHAAAALLVMADGNGYRFTHDLLRQCLADGLSPARRQLLHGRLAARLTERGAAPALVATQLEQALQSAAAVRWRLQAGDDAWRVHALAEAQQQYEQALSDGPNPDENVRAWLALARLHQRQANRAAAVDGIAHAMAASAQASPQARLEARLAAALSWMQGGRVEDALNLLDSLAPELVQGSVTQQAQALTHTAKALRVLGRLTEAKAREGQAIALLAAAPDALVPLAFALEGAARLALTRGEPLEAEALARRAAAAFEASHERAGQAQALSLLAVAILHARGDRAAALQCCQRALALATQARHVPAQRSALLNLIKIHTDQGDAEAALALIDQGQALALGFEHPTAEQAFAQARYFVHYLRGDVLRAEAAAHQLLQLARKLRDRNVLLASLVMVVDLPLNTGQLEAAGILLQECQTLIDEGQLRGATPFDAKRAWWLWLRGELDEAERCVAEAEPLQTLFESRATLAWVGAAVALARGDIEKARQRLAGIDLDADVPTEILAQLLMQHLMLAKTCGQPADATRDRAHALLAAGLVPELEAKALGRLLSPA